MWGTWYLAWLWKALPRHSWMMSWVYIFHGYIRSCYSSHCMKKWRSGKVLQDHDVRDTVNFLQNSLTRTTPFHRLELENEEGSGWMLGGELRPGRELGVWAHGSSAHEMMLLYSTSSIFWGEHSNLNYSLIIASKGYDLNTPSSIPEESVFKIKLDS